MQQQLEMKGSVELIGPERAGEMLKNNTLNRPLSKSTVRKYVGTLERGEWMLTGEPIILAADNTILNGQHRLTSIVESGVSALFLVVRGASKDVFHALDQGKPRCAADILAIAGEKEYTVLARAARTVFCIKANEAAENPVRKPFSLNATPIQIEKIVHNNPDIRDWIGHARPLRHLTSHGMLSGLLYLFAQQDYEKAITFCARLADGTGLTAKHPILVLRDRLIMNRASVMKINSDVAAAFIIKAWNAYKSGKKMNIARWRDDEAFPVIH